MNHPHHPVPTAPPHRRAHCACGRGCLSCTAEELCVSCGSAQEAKQYEYALAKKSGHAAHGPSVPPSPAPATYTCPMHPQVRKSEPGRCPACGMELIAAAPSTAARQAPPAAHAAHDVQQLSHRDHEAAMTDPTMAKAMEADMRRRFWVALALAVPIFLLSPVGASLVRWELPGTVPVNWLLLLLTTPVVFWSGSIFITGTYHSLRARQLNMAVLVATGVLAAYLFSVALTILRPAAETFYEAAALLVTFVLFGHWMEMRSRRGTSEALRALFNLVPPQARVIRHGQEVLVPTAEIVPGDVVLLKPGDKVPVDGEVVSGETAIDEALVSGESLPVKKGIGDRVVGGSVNLTGSVTFRATQVGADTVLGQIIKLVETAQASKAPGQRIADRAAAWLVVVAVGAGVLTFASWLLAGATLLTALTFAIAAVVIACPDALGLATPTAVAVGTGIGARHHILIKDAATLENMSKVTAVVLDKTGTLTEGKPRATAVAARGGFTADAVLAMAAAVEAVSSHPIAAAILAEAKRRQLYVPSRVEGFGNIAGHGVRATVDGVTVLVGTARLLEQHQVAVAPIAAEVEKLVAAGSTVSLVAVNGQAAGVIGVADAVKPTAKAAVEGLERLGITAVMITGDHRRVAEAVAREVGIARVFAEVLPQDKASFVKKLQAEGKFVAMVGDGINDAPALAQADIGIAIGAGTDVAIETASVVLMRSNPADVLSAITLSKATVRKMRQNLFWAAIYNILAIPLAAGVFYARLGWWLRPEFAALLMSASSVIVATNAVLLRRVERQLKPPAATA